MARGSQIAETLSETTGAKLGELQNLTRRAREAGLLPQAGHAYKAAHYSRDHVARVLIGRLLVLSGFNVHSSALAQIPVIERFRAVEGSEADDGRTLVRAGATFGNILARGLRNGPLRAAVDRIALVRSGDQLAARLYLSKEHGDGHTDLWAVQFTRDGQPAGRSVAEQIEVTLTGDVLVNLGRLLAADGPHEQGGRKARGAGVGSTDASNISRLTEPAASPCGADHIGSGSVGQQRSTKVVDHHEHRPDRGCRGDDPPVPRTARAS
jgi:hypothetical protein